MDRDDPTKVIRYRRDHLLYICATHPALVVATHPPQLLTCAEPKRKSFGPCIASAYVMFQFVDEDAQCKADLHLVRRRVLSSQLAETVSRSDRLPQPGRSADTIEKWKKHKMLQE